MTVNSDLSSEVMRGKLYELFNTISVRSNIILLHGKVSQAFAFRSGFTKAVSAGCPSLYLFLL